MYLNTWHIWANSTSFVPFEITISWFFETESFSTKFSSVEFSQILTLETSDQRRHRVDTTPRNHPDLTSVTHGRDKICCHTAENQHYIPSWSGALFCNSIKRFGVRVFHPIVCASSCRRGIKPSIPSGRRSRCCFRPGKSKGRKWSMAHLFPCLPFLS